MCLLPKNILELSPLVPLNGEDNGTPLQYSCLENPMNGGAWWAAVHGVAESRTRLRDFTFTFHFPALEKEMATHSSVLAWRIPGTGEPGGLPSMRSHRVGHNWSGLAAAIAGPKAVWLRSLWNGEIWTQRQTGIDRRQREDTGRSLHTRERGLRRNQPYWHLESRLPASWTMREWIYFCCLSYQALDILLQRPEKMNTKTFEVF